jgi:putative AbiEi antitoxin of type IV toxin-antitoxin system/uncharacterized protein DUF559
LPGLLECMTSPRPTRRSGRNYLHAEVSSRVIDAAIAAVAGKQQGNITRAQLLDLGVGDGGIAWRVSIGRLFRVYRGVYSVGRRPITIQEWASAAVLACGSGAALSHGSAMTLWGYWRSWDNPYEVTVVGDRRTKGIRVHRSTTLQWRDVTKQLGIRVTTPAQTALDMSPRLSDKALKRVVNNMINSLWANEDQFADTLARHPHAPGATRIAKLIGLEGTPTRSGWEDDFPIFCQKYGLPAPVMGQPLFGYIVDALFVEAKVIVELDSWPFHKGKIPFENDRERDAVALTRGYVTVRVTEERLEERPDQEAQRLHKILAIHAPKAA